MTITGFKYGDMLNKDEFRRKDHILFDLPIKHTGLKIYDLAQAPGFNFYKQLIERLSVPLDEYTGTEIGDVWTFEDEEAYVSYHGIVSYSVDPNGEWTGYHPYHYELLVPALDKLYEEQDSAGEWVRPARSTMLGHGTYHATGEGIFPSGYNFPWSKDMGLAVLANTTFETDVWSLDVPDRIEEQYS